VVNGREVRFEPGLSPWGIVCVSSPVSWFKETNRKKEFKGVYLKDYKGRGKRKNQLKVRLRGSPDRHAEGKTFRPSSGQAEKYKKAYESWDEGVRNKEMRGLVTRGGKRPTHHSPRRRREWATE